MEIGHKLKNARLQSGLTQEQAAEALGVSRQTISNWENEKTWPDIVSVVKMSDLYAVSLDHLLKEETSVSNYLDYLEESTNVVASRRRLSKLLIVLGYLAVWALSVLVFWCFTDSGDAMGYSIVFLWLLLPLTTFVLSLLVGKHDLWGKGKWLCALIFGLMYMLAEYATFSTANMKEFYRLNAPSWGMIAVGAVIALLGIAIGSLLGRRKARRP